ncbi:MAG: hypothetical protein ACI4QM_01245 [Alphaproteobacteria bacterium]
MSESTQTFLFRFIGICFTLNALSGLLSLCSAPFNENLAHLFLTPWIYCAVTALASCLVLKGYHCAVVVYRYCQKL